MKIEIELDDLAVVNEGRRLVVALPPSWDRAIFTAALDIAARAVTGASPAPEKKKGGRPKGSKTQPPPSAGASDPPPPMCQRHADCIRGGGHVGACMDAFNEKLVAMQEGGGSAP